MNTGSFDDFERVDAILRQALELAPDDRERFVTRACGTDEGLLERVRAMLTNAEGPTGGITPGGAMRGPVWDGIGRDAGAGDITAGARFGPWQVGEEIGRGGMAVVYRGQRADGAFEQQVAIKLLRASRAGSLEKRFLRERRILARLEHPNIARLLDAGTADSGRSYLVMEFVQGEPIDLYCGRRQLSIGDRLRLFLKVCAAVQFAHRNLVVHRDLKPSNILVTAGGESKLLDFGIAKLLEADPETSDFTQTALIDRVLTPQYASPEQVLGEPVTTATDVYALGLLLYELLTGQRTRRFDTSSPREIERVICDTDPVAPSLAVSPPRLARRLKGDLDNIVLKALRREPERRYASAEQLASDVHSHLEGRPVVARPDSAVYRLQKFVSRHTVGVATSVGIVLLTAGLIAFYTERLAKERDSARQAAESARIEALTATQVSDFLTALFQAGDPQQWRGGEPTVAVLLDQAARDIGEQLADQPAVQARLSAVIGGAYSNLGRYDEAQSLLEQAVDLNRAALGQTHPELAISLRRLALVHYRRGDYDTAKPLFESAARIQAQALGAWHHELAETLGWLGNLEKRSGNLDLSRAHFERALDIAERALGPDHTHLAFILNNFGLLLMESGEFAQARDLYLRALAIHEREFGVDSLRVAQTLDNLNIARGKLGEHDTLVETARRVLAINERQLGVQHPDVAANLVHLGMAYQSTGRDREAIPVYESAIAIYTQLFEDDHPYLTYPLGNLANVYRDIGDYPAALPLYQQALAIAAAKNALQEEVRLFSNRARLRLLMDEPSAAEIDLRRALEVSQTLHPAGGWQIASTRSLLAESLIAQGNFEAAEALLLASHAELDKAPIARRTEHLQRLIALYQAWGRPDRAREYRRQMEDIDPP